MSPEDLPNILSATGVPPSVAAEQAAGLMRQRVTQLDSQIAERERRIQALTRVGSQAAVRRATALRDEVRMLNQDRDRLDSALQKRVFAQEEQAQKPIQAGMEAAATTGARLTTEQGIKGDAYAKGQKALEFGDIKTAERMFIESQTPKSSWPMAYHRMEKEFNAKLQRDQRVAALAEKSSHDTAAALEAWEQMNALAKQMFTVPGGDIVALLKHRLALEKQAIWQNPNLPNVRTYDDAVVAHGMVIAKALTGTGRLAASEVFGMIRGFPKKDGPGGVPDAKETAMKKMDIIHNLIKKAARRPINPDKAFDLVEVDPNAKRLEDRFQVVPLSPGVTPGAAPPAGTPPAPAEMSDEEIDAEIRRLEGGK